VDSNRAVGIASIKPLQTRDLLAIDAHRVENPGTSVARLERETEDAMRDAGPYRMTVSIRLGKTKGARLTGPHYHVLGGWALLLLAIVVVVFIVGNTSGCPSASVKAAVAAFN
jgi:hypothetical protein